METSPTSTPMDSPPAWQSPADRTCRRCGLPVPGDAEWRPGLGWCCPASLHPWCDAIVAAGTLNSALGLIADNRELVDMADRQMRLSFDVKEAHERLADVVITAVRAALSDGGL